MIGFDVIWAKVSTNSSCKQWLPLKVHSFDTMVVSEHLWNEWVPKHTKETIEEDIVGQDVDAIGILRFLSATHDVGKAIPAFQRKDLANNADIHNFFIENLVSCGLPCNNKIVDNSAIHHSLASELILERNGVPRCISSIVGSHHGNTQSISKLCPMKISSYKNNTGFSEKEWIDVQNSFLTYAYTISENTKESISKIILTERAQVLLSALLIISDWIASNENWFPMTGYSTLKDSELRLRGENGWKKAKIPPVWNVKINGEINLFETRFGISNPYPFQKILTKCALEIKSPGIFIVEAPMGEGKTEAALVASEIMSDKFGMGGVLFALPTQATADGMFPRMKKWIDQITVDPKDVNSIFLAHGKSKFNKEYTSMIHYGWGKNSLLDDRSVIHEWFNGKKKGLLSDFAIGTVDNVLMGGLKLKHLALRHLALTNKVIIIDECHAYDSYMGSYLSKIISWLGMYNVPVIVLSATLYPSRREELIKAYLGKNLQSGDDKLWITSKKYPSLTYTDGCEVKQVGCDPSFPSKEITIEKKLYSEFLDCVKMYSSNGGYIGIICNTVSKAQQFFEMISDEFPDDEVFLLHSKYTCFDRTEKESNLLQRMSKYCRQSPPFRMFVIGTQVIEQSLDLDFDILFTELCPVDLLLQRIGRLHRHYNKRPCGLEIPRCVVIDDGGFFDKGTEYVYGKYQLYNTRILLKDRISIPDDIPELVHLAYSDKLLDIDPKYVSEYQKSFEEAKMLRYEKERKASVFQICNPYGDNFKENGLTDWLTNNASDDFSGNRASATVRDTNGSIEVILVKDNGDGTLSPISGDDSLKLDVKSAIDEKTAFTLAGCKVMLPSRFVSDKTICGTFKELYDTTLNKVPDSWVSNGWLKDELFLISDSNGNIDLNGVKMRYCNEKGLVIIE